MEVLVFRAGIPFRPWMYAVAAGRNKTSEAGEGNGEGGVINLVHGVNSMGWNLGEKGTRRAVNLKVPANKRRVVASIALGQITSREGCRHEAGKGG